MAANTSPIFQLKPLPVGGAQFTSADTTTKKTICTGATDGTRIDAIYVCSDDSAAVNLMFYLNDGSTDFYIGNVNIPAGSGYTTVVRVDAMSTLAPSLGYIWLEASKTLKAKCLATMTAAKTMDVVPVGGIYS